MLDQFKNTIRIAIIFLSFFLFSGCASKYTKISSSPGTAKEILGPTTGSACGMLGISVAPPGQFIPIALLGRYSRAYQEALNKSPRSTGLIDITIEEYWYFPIFGVMRCVTITGVAVR